MRPTTRLCFLLSLLLLASCAKRLTYDQWSSRYVSTKTDTTYQTVTLTIPKDSVSYSFRNDTVYRTHTVRNNRAILTITKSATGTTAECECDTASIQKKVMQTIDQNLAGVDPRYEKQAHTWRTVSLGLIGLLIVGVVAYLLIHQFRLSIARR